jgi:ubiquinone/menaquinone biosynthesis C-methylase UbiE
MGNSSTFCERLCPEPLTNRARRVCVRAGLPRANTLFEGRCYLRDIDRAARDRESANELRMTADVAETERDVAPQPVGGLRLACPRCRHSIEIRADLDTVQCPHCAFEARKIAGIWSFLPTASVNGWQQFFERLSRSRDANTSAANDYRFSIQQHYIIAGFRRLCGDLAADKQALDVGCGNGMFWKALFGSHPVVGIDYSLGMCALARGRGMRVYQADAMALPFSDDEFDLIYSAEVLQCVVDLPALLTELTRVCRPGGRIVVSTLNRTSLFRHAMHVVRKLIPHPGASTHAASVMRTAEEIIASSRGLPLFIGRTCWAHFPLPWLVCSHSNKHIFEPVATNVIVEFIKPVRPGP